MRALLSILFVLFYIKAHSCDCSYKLLEPFKTDNYKDSELIFIGEVGKQIKQGQFELKVVEVLKGEVKSVTTILNPEDNYCFEKVKEGEKWLIYTDLDITDIYIDECSRSRDIKKTKYWVIPPPLPSTKKRAKEV